MNIKNAKVNKRIPKNRFSFDTSQIDSLTWLYKISYDTIGIKDSDEFKEYQIFEIVFKEKIGKDTIIKIQAAIPYPILFLAKSGSESIYMFCRGKIVLETATSLVVGDTLNIQATSIAKLVFNTVIAMAEVVPKQDETLDDYIARYQQIKKLTKDSESLQRQVDGERQPKKRVELNERLGKVRKELVGLEDVRHKA